MVPTSTLNINEMFSINYPADCRFGYSETNSEFLLRDSFSDVQFTDQFHLFIRQLGMSGILASTIRVSFSNRSVVRIVFWRSKIQVIRITAGSIIAMMKYPFFFWVSMNKHPCHSATWITPAFQFKLTVSIKSSWSKKRPAFIWTSLLNLIPKSLRHRCPFRFPCLQRAFSAHNKIISSAVLLSTP